MSNVVQSTALLISNKHNADTQFVFTLVLGVFSAIEDAYELYHVIKDLPSVEEVNKTLDMVSRSQPWSDYDDKVVDDIQNM